MTDRRALITGGAGLVGSHLADALVRAGMPEIVVLDNFSRGRRENLCDATASGRVRIIEGDVANPADVARAMDGVSLVFHQAGIRITQCAEDPRLAMSALVDGTFNVLEACVANHIQRLVYSSSASVYGNAVEVPMTEDHPHNNRTFYGATKIAGEQMCRAFHHRYGLDYVALLEAAERSLRDEGRRVRL